MKPKAFPCLPFAVVAVLSMHESIRAATATWNNIATDFNTGANWTGGTGAGGIPGTGDNATFNTDVTNQPDLSASLQIQGLTFSTATGGWNLTKTGASALTLTNTGTTASSAINSANTSGTNTISANLILGGAASTTATITQTRGGALAITGDISSANSITGISVAAATGTGNAILTLSGNNTYSGNTTVSSNQTININSASAISSGTLVFSGSVTIDNSSDDPFLVLPNNNINLSGGSLTYTGTGGNSLSFGNGVVTASGANRTLTVNSGILTVGSLAADTAGRTISKGGAGGTLVITNAADASFQGGYLTGAGITLIGAKTSLGSGTITLSGGTLAASADLSGSEKIANNFLITAGTTVGGSNSMEFGGKLTGNTGGGRQLTNSISGGGMLTLNDIDISNDVSVARTFTLAGTANTTINGVIANGVGTTTANPLTITNTGITTLNGNNTYTGLTTVTTANSQVILNGDSTGGGGVTFNNASASLTLGSSSTPSGVGSTVTSGPLGSGILNLGAGALSAAGGTRTIANNINNVANTSPTIGAGSDLILNGNIGWNGSSVLTVNNNTTFGGVLTLRNNPGENTPLAQRTLTVAGSGTARFNGAIVNGTTLNGILAISGSGTVELNGNNTHSGQTTVSAGQTTRLGHASGLGSGGITSVAGATLVANGGTLDLGGQSQIHEAITINGHGVGGDGALVNSNTGETAVIGNGVAQLSLGTGGTYTGVPAITIVNGGGATANALLGLIAGSIDLDSSSGTYTTAPTITITGGGGTGAVATVNLAGVVNINSAGYGYTSAPTITVSGGVLESGSPWTATATGDFGVTALQLTNAGSGVTGATSVSFDSGAATATAHVSSVALASASSVGGPGNITINAPVTGSNPLTKIGAGTLTLAGTNTYSGATQINGGKLVVNGSISTGSVTVADTASVGGTGMIGGAITVNSGGKIAPGTSIGTLAALSATTFEAGSSLEIELNSSTSDRLNVSGNLNIADATLNITALAPASAGVYVIAAYASLTGSEFFSVNGLPAGYEVQTNYNGLNQIALVQTGQTPYQQWATSPPYNLAGADALPGADPDNDGVKNILEFALNSNPASGSSTGLSFSKMATVAGTPRVLTLTIAVRNGASFSPAGNRQKSAVVDGITYTVEASNTLSDWGGPVVTEVTGGDATAIQAGLPAPDAGWSYKTFRTDGSADSDTGDFIRAGVE